MEKDDKDDKGDKGDKGDRVHWEHMSTAPKDGTRILIINHDFEMSVAWWSGFEWLAESSVQNPKFWTPTPWFKETEGLPAESAQFMNFKK